MSVVVYSTHTNWREQSKKLDEQLKAKTGELAALKKSKADMETLLQNEVKAEKDRNVQLSEKIAQIDQDNQKLTADIAELEKKRTEEVEAVKVAEETTNKLRERYDAASKALLKAQNDWAEMSSELTAKIDESHSLALQLTTYQSVTSQLSKDYRDAVEVLKKHGLTAAPELYSTVPPAGIQGVVTEVRPKGLIQLSIGADSGLVKGQQLDVVRSLEGRSSYVGKVEIIETASDSSVAKVLPEFRRGTVQVNDEVKYIDINELTAK
ncbi:hypothetical protein FACS189419_01800 [Planctomycetales bacterium]|nr:hypothetical protein FACS189419_01800 [Planctomycetales bacterium]